MIALRNAGISSRQFLTVWNTNANIGFTPAQLVVADVSFAEMQNSNITISQMYNGGISIAYLLGNELNITEMYSNGIPGYALFNEACNTPLSSGSPPEPIIRLLSTNLSPANAQVMLEGNTTAASSRWRITGINGSINFNFVDDTSNATRTLGRQELSI